MADSISEMSPLDSPEWKQVKKFFKNYAGLSMKHKKLHVSEVYQAGASQKANFLLVSKFIIVLENF